jgi:oxygen-dependent protoporphyrinogen oxidase
MPDSAFPKPLRGFGFLVPRSEKIHILGTLFSSALFPGRAPADRQLLTSFIGGAFEPSAVDWTDTRLWETASAELRAVLKTSADPQLVRIIRRHHAIPQYRIGHEHWVAALRDELECAPGLFLAGNYMDGVSVASCIETGERIARRVADYVRSG